MFNSIIQFNRTTTTSTNTSTTIFNNNINIVNLIINTTIN